MIKEKVMRPEESWDAIAGRLADAFDGYEKNTLDGLRFSRDDEWIHVRPSGTEPVVRLIAEAPEEALTRALLDRARDVVFSAAEGGK